MRGVYKRGNNWYIDYDAGNKRIRQVIGPCKKTAENTLRKRKVEVAENKHLDIKKNEKSNLRTLRKHF